MFNPFQQPELIKAEVFMSMPAKFRKKQRTSWSDPNRQGAEVECFLEGPSFDREGNLWIGTDGGGLDKVDAQSGKATRFTTANSTLTNDTVLGILPGDHGVMRSLDQACAEPPILWQPDTHFLSTPEEFGQLIESEMLRWGRVVRALKALRTLKSASPLDDVRSALQTYLVILFAVTTIIGAVVVVGDEGWFFKLKGSKALAAQEKQSFVAFAKSVKFTK